MEYAKQLCPISKEEMEKMKMNKASIPGPDWEGWALAAEAMEQEKNTCREVMKKIARAEYDQRRGINVNWPDVEKKLELDLCVESDAQETQELTEPVIVSQKRVKRDNRTEYKYQVLVPGQDLDEERWFTKQQLKRDFAQTYESIMDKWKRSNENDPLQSVNVMEQEGSREKVIGNDNVPVVNVEETMVTKKRPRDQKPAEDENQQGSVVLGSTGDLEKPALRFHQNPEEEKANGQKDPSGAETAHEILNTPPVMIPLKDLPQMNENNFHVNLINNLMGRGTMDEGQKVDPAVPLSAKYYPPQNLQSIRRRSTGQFLALQQQNHVMNDANHVASTSKKYRYERKREENDELFSRMGGRKYANREEITPADNNEAHIVRPAAFSLEDMRHIAPVPTHAEMSMIKSTPRQSATLDKAIEFMNSAVKSEQKMRDELLEAVSEAEKWREIAQQAMQGQHNPLQDFDGLQSADHLEFYNLNQHQEKIQSMEEEISFLKHLMENKDKELKKSERQCRSSQNKINNLNLKVGALEEDLRTVDDALLSVRTELADKKQEVKVYEQACAEMKARIDFLERNMGARKRKIEKYHRLVKQLADANNSLKSSEADLSKELESTRETITKMEEQERLLKEAIQEIEIDLQQAHGSNIEMYNQMTESINKQKNEGRQQNKKLEKRLQLSEDKNCALEETIRELENRVKVMNENAEVLKREILQVHQSPGANDSFGIVEQLIEMGMTMQTEARESAFHANEMRQSLAVKHVALQSALEEYIRKEEVGEGEEPRVVLMDALDGEDAEPMVDEKTVYRLSRLDAEDWKQNARIRGARKDPVSGKIKLSVLFKNTNENFFYDSVELQTRLHCMNSLIGFYEARVTSKS